MLGNHVNQTLNFNGNIGHSFSAFRPSQNISNIIHSNQNKQGIKRKTYDDRPNIEKFNKNSRIEDCFHQVRSNILHSNDRALNQKIKQKNSQKIEENHKKNNEYINSIRQSSLNKIYPIILSSKSSRENYSKSSNFFNTKNLSRYIYINKQITQASSPINILNLLKHEIDLNEINVATAIHRIAKLRKRNWRISTQEHSLLIQLANSCLKNMRPRDIANIIWAFAKLSIFNRTFMQAVANETESQIRNYKPQDLSNTAWAFAKLNIFNPILM